MKTPTGDEDARASAPPPALGPAGLAVLATFTVRGAAPPLFEAMRPELWLVPDRRLGWSMTAFALAALAAWIAAARRLAARGAPGVAALGAALVAAGGAGALCAAARGPFTLLALRAVAGAAAGVALAIVPGVLGPAERLAPGAVGRLALGAPAGLAAGCLVASVFQRWPSWRGGLVASGALAAAAGLAIVLRRAPPGSPRRPVSFVPPALGPALRRLRADRPRALALGSAAAWAFGASALAAWVPAFLERSRGMPRPLATSGVGVLAVLVGFSGLWAGARLVRALEGRAASPELWAAAGASGGAGIVAVGLVTAWRPGLYLPALLAALLLAAAAAAPLVLAIRDSVPAPERGALLPAALLAILAVGDAPAPLVVGLVADRLSIGRAMVLVPIAFLAAGALAAAAARAARRYDPSASS